jgi:GTPase-associated protein 1, C-terminal domain/GTPase-associated protein 1, N-terminal domain type 2/GTPase-associated protein 1, middle domain
VQRRAGAEDERVTGAFHTYIYTNCRADEGLQQRDGFQFQAISPEANRAAMPLVQRRLLYEPAPKWMRERRPVSDYPPSFAHVCDSGLYATAAGIYLGRESSGGREGNQLTHAIATEHAGAYGLVRPAQLFGAPFWTTVPAPTRQCPPLEPGWEPGPFDVPRAQAFVAAQDRGGALLTALVSHLRRGDTDRRRVLFRARQPELVLNWITAATLLIPHRQALTLDFKIFTLNPAYADHRILAVHPDWTTGSVSLDNQLGYVVFDLEENGWTPVPEDPESRQWVQLFLTEDPYDVVDAVEVAAEASAAHAELGGARVDFARAVVLGTPPRAEAIRPIIGWLRARRPELIERYGPDIVDRLLSTAQRWPAPELAMLEAAVRTAVPHRAAQVRLGLLRAEMHELTTASVVPPDRLEPLGEPLWGEAAQVEATDLLADAMRDASPQHFELLLRLCHRFRLRPAQPLLEPGLQRFVEWWSLHPERHYNPDAWADGHEVEGKLRVLLNRRMGDDPTHPEAEHLADRWWVTLLTQPADLRTPLDRAVVSAAMRELDDKHRAGFVRSMFDEARAAADPAAAFRELTATLWRREAPTMAESQRLAVLLPKGLVFDAGFFPTLADGLRAERITDRHFQAAWTLFQEKKIWQPEQQLCTRLRHEADIRYVIGKVRKGSADSDELALIMRRIPAPTLQSHRKQLLDALQRGPLVADTLAVLEATPGLQVWYTQRVGGLILSGTWQPRHMAMVFVLERLPQAYPTPHDLPLRKRLKKVLDDFVIRASDGRFGEVDRQIGQLDDPWPSEWARYLRSLRPRGSVGRIIRRDR